MGYNTDGRGLLESLRDDAGFLPEGKRAVVLGSGGAAGAIVAALVLGRVSHMTVVSRDPAHADELIARMAPYARDTELVGGRHAGRSASAVRGGRPHRQRDAAGHAAGRRPAGYRPNGSTPGRSSPT